MDRRRILSIGAYTLGALTYSSIYACKPKSRDTLSESNSMSKEIKPLKLSLAQWSLHKGIWDGTINPQHFAPIAKETYGIDAVEYVNQFYVDQAKDEAFWIDMKDRADKAGVKSLLIMVDDEGELGDVNGKRRLESVDRHKKWVHAAKILGCHSIRVNAFGADDRAKFKQAIIDGMSRLSEYAAQEDINVIIENHGLFSSDAQFIAAIIKEVNLPNFGSFPDFGNWCTSTKWGSTQIPCDNVYDIYQGVSEMMPFAKAVSAKSYDFDKDGNDTRIDYTKMLGIVKNSDYNGHIGIEYEGELLSEHEGILATKNLIHRVWDNV